MDKMALPAIESHQHRPLPSRMPSYHDVTKLNATPSNSKYGTFKQQKNNALELRPPPDKLNETHSGAVPELVQNQSSTKQMLNQSMNESPNAKP